MLAITLPAVTLPAVTLLAGLPAAEAAPRAIVLGTDPVPVHTAPDPGSPTVAALPADTVAELLAIGTVHHRATTQDWLGHPMMMVRSGALVGWVHGEGVAVEQSWNGPGEWTGERVGTPGGPGPTTWSASRTGREWSDALEGWDRVVHDGWVVVQDEAHGTRRIPWSHSNGWGTSRGAETIVLRDITGDGHTDVFAVVHETVTEAGSAGRTLELWDFSRAETTPLFTLPVNDPHWNGLATQDAFGRARVEVERGHLSVETTILHLDACGSAAARTGEGCLSLQTQRWQWDGAAVAKGTGTTRRSVPAVLDAGGVHPTPALSGPDRAHPGGTVCVDRIRGPLTTGDPLQVHVGPCAAGTGPEGWVDGSRVHPDEAFIAALLAPPEGPPPPAVVFPWTP